MRSAVILGCGRMGREHALAYRELGVPITHVFDIDSAQAEKFAREFGGTAGDLQGVGATRDPERIASICSWDDAHGAQIAWALIRAGTVIAEKPLCLTFRELEMIARLADGGLTCNLPLCRAIAPTREPYHIEADYIWGRADRMSGWRKDCPGYSFVLGGGVHAADIICHYGRPSSVAAVASDPSGFGAPTVISASGRFDDGRTFRMDVNCANIGEHCVRVVEWLSRGRRELRLDGSDKRAMVKDAVENGNAYPAFEAHALCFAIERSLKSRQVERVIYPP